MQYPNQFNQYSRLYRLITLLALSLLLASCAHAPWEKPREKTNPLEEDIKILEKQVSEDPESTKLRQDLYVTKAAVTQELMLLAEQSILAGDKLAAQLYYERILAYDPRNSTALAALTRLSKAQKGEEKLYKIKALQKNKQLTLAKKLAHEATLEAPHNAQVQQVNREINQVLGIKTSEPPKLKPSSNKPVTLELRDADIKVVLQALSRATGLNFILDKDIRKGTKASVFVRKLPVEDAIDLVLSSNGLQKKNLSENTALIFPATTKKLKDYRDLMIRSFYLTNTSAKQVATMLKSVLKVKSLFIDERVNMVVIRDTPEVVRLAEKLIKANDIEVAEVVLDIEVLEVTRSRLQELGVQYPTQLSVISDSKLTIDTLKNVDSTVIGVTPGPVVKANKTTGDVNLLSNPRIRVKNNEKAKIHVGERVPIFTTVTTNNIATESVEYVDVGLKLDVEPKVTLDNYVNIKVDLEVSSLGDKEQGNNSSAFRIGTRETSTVLRLKDGETQILAGLIQDDERNNSVRVPGIGDVPIIGRLFGTREDRRTKTEIVLAITPRIVGQVALPSADISEYWSGTETQITDKPSVIIPPSSSGRGGATSSRQDTANRLRQQGIERNRNADKIPGETTQPEAKPAKGSNASNPAGNAAGSKPATPTTKPPAVKQPIRF